MTTYSSDPGSEFKKTLKRYENLENPKENKYFNKSKEFFKFLQEGAKDIPIALIEELKGKVPNSKDGWKEFFVKHTPEIITLGTYLALLGIGHANYHADSNYASFTRAGITTEGSIRPWHRKPLTNPNGKLIEKNFRPLTFLESDAGGVILGAIVTLSEYALRAGIPELGKAVKNELPVIKEAIKEGDLTKIVNEIKKGVNYYSKRK